MLKEEFEKLVYENSGKHYWLCTPPTNAQVGLDILIKHFLGDDWYSVSNINNEQVNTEAIYEILSKYPRKHERIKKWIKNSLIKLANKI